MLFLRTLLHDRLVLPHVLLRRLTSLLLGLVGLLFTLVMIHLGKKEKRGQNSLFFVTIFQFFPVYLNLKILIFKTYEIILNVLIYSFPQHSLFVKFLLIHINLCSVLNLLDLLYLKQLTPRVVFCFSEEVYKILYNIVL